MPKSFGLPGVFVNRAPDSDKIAAAFHQNAARYDQHILVQKRIVQQLAASIELHLNRVPVNILDVGTGTGALLERLVSRYPQSCLTGVDIALNMCLRTRNKLGRACHVVTGNAECLPFQSGFFDLAVSASVLQWVGNLSAALAEMRRVVRPGGDINLAFFCDGTLTELQQCIRDAASNSGGQGISRLHRFRTVEEVKSIVEGMDFEKAVITVETETDWHDDLYSLLRSIKNIGAGTVAGGTAGGLGWRGMLKEASRLYEERYGQSGRIPASYNVLYLTARTGELTR
jgi:malonyl-CoA O-methyltransferase